MDKPYLKVNPDDNVFVALGDLHKGMMIEGVTTFELLEDIPQKHKFADTDLRTADIVRMYGVEVGRANVDLRQGQLLTTDNITHSVTNYSASGKRTKWIGPDVSDFKDRTFRGFHREDGKVGTSNHWLVIPLVFCENRNVDIIREALLDSLGYNKKRDFNVNTYALIERHELGATDEEILSADVFTNPEELLKNHLFPNVDGIQFLNHNGGCGGTREDSQMLVNLLAGYINNPNVAGATVLSLGCQHAQVQLLEEAVHRMQPNFKKPLYVFEQQKMVSERQLISEAVKHTFVGLRNANKFERESSLSLIHISEPTRQLASSRMPSSA